MAVWSVRRRQLTEIQKQIGRYAIAAAMNEVLTRSERVDQMEIRVCAPLEEKKNASL